MPKKTLKQKMKKNRHHTQRRIPRRPKKGGATMGPPPDAAFKEVTPVNSDNVMGKIA